MIEPTRILLLRHGQTAWNVEGRVQGQLDIDLDDTGRWQALQLALRLASEDLVAIYSSDLRRASATAEPLARTARLAVVTDPALRERGLGAFEGLTHADIEQRHPQDAQRWRRREPGFGPGGGETLQTFYARSLAAVARLAAGHAGEAIAVVAHGGVLDCLYRAAVGAALDAPRSWALGNAAVNRLLYTGEGFSLVGWNDRAHLDDPSGALDEVSR